MVGYCNLENFGIRFNMKKVWKLFWEIEVRYWGGVFWFDLVVYMICEYDFFVLYLLVYVVNFVFVLWMRKF